MKKEIILAKFLIIITDQGGLIVGFSSNPINPDISLQRIGTNISTWGINGYQQENGIYTLPCRISIKEGHWSFVEETWSSATAKDMKYFELPLAESS